MTVLAADGVAEVTLSRPPVNAVSVRMYEELTAAFRALSRRNDVHAVVLRSDQRMFCAGADIKQQVDSPTIAESTNEYRQRLARMCYDAILDCAVPTIAAVHGHAIGAGAVLAACCDIRYASDDARLGLPEINVGRCGGGRHLMRLVPQGATRLMYFTGEPVDAQEAWRFGLVQRVVAPDELLDSVRELAAKIAAKSPLGLRLAKKALNESESLGVREGYAHEQIYTLQLAESPDAAEAARSVLEKRPPKWSWPATPVAM
ncbi:enoyl-CoA hydratase [Streptomyces sp. SID8361]|nr:enoyl-CoA hydratase [Streptomyces sp. SID8361]